MDQILVIISVNYLAKFRKGQIKFPSEGNNEFSSHCKVSTESGISPTYSGYIKSICIMYRLEMT